MLVKLTYADFDIILKVLNGTYNKCSAYYIGHNTSATVFCRVGWRTDDACVAKLPKGDRDCKYCREINCGIVDQRIACDHHWIWNGHERLRWSSPQNEYYDQHKSSHDESDEEHCDFCKSFPVYQCTRCGFVGLSCYGFMRYNRDFNENVCLKCQIKEMEAYEQKAREKLENGEVVEVLDELRKTIRQRRKHEREKHPNYRRVA